MVQHIDAHGPARRRQCRCADDCLKGLHVMSFAVRNSGAKDGLNGWKYRKELFFATIAAPACTGTKKRVFENLLRAISAKVIGIGFGLPMRGIVEFTADRSALRAAS
jgi:hypothetical protein